jgi:hypothetical protein
MLEVMAKVLAHHIRVFVNFREDVSPVLINLEEFSASENPMHLLAGPGVHLEISHFVRRFVKRDSLLLVFFHMNNEVLHIDGIVDGVFDDYLMATGGGITGIHVNIFINSRIINTRR